MSVPVCRACFMECEGVWAPSRGWTFPCSKSTRLFAMEHRNDPGGGTVVGLADAMEVRGMGDDEAVSLCYANELARAERACNEAAREPTGAELFAGCRHRDACRRAFARLEGASDAELAEMTDGILADVLGCEGCLEGED